MSIFICPNCKQSLSHSEHGLRCQEGHCFDISAEGYVHLLPANRKHSKLPGDTPEMVRARAEFLAGGYYAPLKETLCRAVSKAADGCSRPVVLDCGCGEGYYTEGLCRALEDSLVYGVDISKLAVKKAAKQAKNAKFAVASVYHLPVADSCVDVLTNVFAPLSPEEFLRVLKPGGRMIYVVPGENHLWQMKEILYDTPYKNKPEKTEYPGFVYEDILRVRETVRLENPAIRALFSMTPYLWRTPKEGVTRLENTETLQTEIAFDLHIFRKEEKSV